MARRARKSTNQNGLTGIPQPIHCPATTDGGGNGESNYGELERIQINHFLETLARIALSVAARESSKQDG